MLRSREMILLCRRVAEAVDHCLDLQGELVVANLLVAGEAPARQAA
jgi:hypothetical protein